MAMTEKQGGSDVRANTTRAHPRRRRRSRRGLRAGRPQVLRLGADVRRVPGAGAGAGRAVVLPAAALAAGRHQEPAAGAAPEAQDGQRVQRLAARPSCAARWPGWSARKAAACARSSRWWR
ncbi:MAG: hypothetical protein MZV49_22845 [Rhodopseudomonas palustris]|nr:hypothetical protein [Rhodopseudomonas palustris]